MANYELPKFTPEEYAEYCSQPYWRLDGHNTEEENDSYWSQEIKKMVQAYEQYAKDTKVEWNDAFRYVEEMPSKNVDAFVPDTAIAKEKLPYALWAGVEQVATLFGNLPVPKFLSPSEPLDQYTNALEQITDIELKDNDFNSLAYDMGWDLGITSLGILKVYVDYDQPGPYGQQGKIVIQRIDPMNVAFDTKAKRLKWCDLGYFIVRDTVDLGSLRKVIVTGKLLKEENQ